MGIGTGLGEYIGFALESTPGVPVTPTVTLPFISHSLKRAQPRIEAKGKIAGRRFLDAAHWTGGNIDPGGGVQMELHSQGVGPLFTALFGTVSSTTGPASGIYTHTWSSLGQPLPFTTQLVTPATNEVLYPSTYAGSMMESAEFAFSAGEYATMGFDLAAMKCIHYRTVSDGVTTNGSAVVTSATAAWVFDDVGKPISGTGIPSGTTVLSVQSTTSATLSANATATGSSIAFVIGVAAAATAYPTTMRPFAFHEVAPTIAGSAASVKKLTFSVKTGISKDRYFLSSPERKVPLEGDLHEISGSADIEFSSRTEYLRFVYGSQVALTVPCTHPTGESLTFTLNVRYDGESPGDNGRDIVPQSLPFKAVGSTDAAACSVVYKTTDATVV